MVGKYRFHKKYYSYLVLLVIASACSTKRDVANEYESENLVISQLSENVFQHESFFDSEQWGRVGCNGAIFRSGDEVVIIDTPVDDIASKELIGWIEEQWKSKVVAVVATHFHRDCIGGLNEFHNYGIPSFASNETIELARAESEVIPTTGFLEYFEIEVGDDKVVNRYFGAGHTEDNIVSYFPSGNALFGGCLIKTYGAGKGNLADADTLAWSETVSKVLAEYQDSMVIPGHGRSGGAELLQYTIDLFDRK